MIRKGLRPRIKFATGLPDPGSDFRRVLPFRRSWLAIGILAAVDAVFLFPAVSAFQEAVAHWSQLDDLFSLVIALFTSAWLLGWSIGPLLITTILTLLLFGREVVTARPGKLRVSIGLPFVGMAGEYDVSRMRNARLEHPPQKSGKSWRGPHLAFDYGANVMAFGSDINEAEFNDLVSNIQAATGQVIRSGDATDEELQGEWGPGKLAKELATPEPEVFEPVVTAEPVNLASPSTLALIVANLVPLAGAAFLGWKLSDVMVLYWAESAIIGFFNICKIAVIGRWFALLAGPFFVGHFGAFMSVHFLFIYSLFVKGPQDDMGGDLTEVAQLFTDLWPALAALFVSHLFSFFANFLGRREYQDRTMQSQMSEPYSRIFFMHLVLIFGGGMTLALGEPAPVLFIVIVLKIWFDVKAHLKQRASHVNTP